jgi:hypothetical protein
VERIEKYFFRRNHWKTPSWGRIINGKYILAVEWNSAFRLVTVKEGRYWWGKTRGLREMERAGEYEKEGEGGGGGGRVRK